MGSDGEFGPDTETIRAWLEKRATYAQDARVSAAPAADRTTTDRAPTHRAPVAEPAGPDNVDVARSVLAALGDERPEEPTRSPAERPAERRGTRTESARDDRSSWTRRRPLRRQPEPTSAPTPTPEPTEAHDAHTRPAPTPRITAPPQVRIGRWTEPVDNLTVRHATTDVEFPPRAGARRSMSVLLILVLAAACTATYLAYREPTTATIGIAGTFGVLTLVVWAVRASTTITRISIRRGQLVVRRGGRVETAEVGSHYTPVAILGEPGQRRWRVLVERAGQPLMVITPGMVDPHWFTTSLYRIRPDLRPEAKEALRRSADAEATALGSRDAG